MINIKQTVGSGLSNITINEQTFATYTGFTDQELISFNYASSDWNYEGSVVDLTDYGISFSGTPTDGDVLPVSYIPGIIQFFAGEGISAPDLNSNFEALRVQTNTNEANIGYIATNALRIDGSNITDATVAALNRTPVVILGTSGSLQLTDNADHFLAPTGNCTLVFPTITPGDGYSHTINVAVQGSNFGVTHGLAHHLLNDLTVDTTAPYNLLFMYNHSDGNWYYYLTQ